VELQDYVTAWEQSLRSLLSVLATLPGDDWLRPTELPGWTVHDVVAHLAAAERELLGDPRPATLSAYGPHVLSDFGRHMEDGVDARRRVRPEALVAELRDALEARLPQARAARAGDAPVRVVADEDWDMTELLRNRAFDAWMHEQDVRRAVTHPGNLGGPGALVTWEMLTDALPVLVARRAGARPGQRVVLQARGAVGRTATVLVDERGRGRLAGADGGPAGGADGGPAGDDDGAATATLVADWETVVRLLGGRLSPNDAVVEMSGDADLARRLVDGFCFTP
jgi:uncharacterized protein (TIGR03083 family)